MDQARPASGAAQRPHQARPSRRGSRPGPESSPRAETVAAPPRVPDTPHHASQKPADDDAAHAVADEERAWDRIAELMIELALNHDPNIVEPIDPLEP